MISFLCGDETIDGGTSQVSAQIAEFLDIPNVMHVCKLKHVKDDTFRCFSRMEQGLMEVEISRPMMLSVAKDINKPRYVTMVDILDAEEKPINVLSAEDVEVDREYVGLENSLTQMEDLYLPNKKRTIEMIKGNIDEIADKLVEKLSSLGFCRMREE